jgi:pimeloyl-ACP methyl ester carboxylesterase
MRCPSLAELTITSLTRQGPSEFIVHGSLSDWTVIPRLHHIKVPVFMYNGQFDAASDSAVRPFFEGIEKIRWVTVENASHMTHLEHREKMIKLVGDFLN